VPHGLDRPAQEGEPLLQAGDPLRQPGGPVRGRSGQGGAEPHEDAEHGEDEQQCRGGARQAQPPEQAHGRLEQELKDEGEHHGQDEVAGDGEHAEQQQDELADL
jgi:hypothetical protein